MSPSTSTPQDAFKVPKPGWFTCYLCKPPVHDRGGQAAFYAHWNRLHLTTKGKP